MVVLKARVLDIWPKPFTTHGVTGGFLLMNVAMPKVGFMVRMNLNFCYLSWCRQFLHCLIYWGNSINICISLRGREMLHLQLYSQSLHGRRGIQEPSTWSPGSKVSLGWDNVKAYVLCCFPKSLSRILHQLLIVVMCLKMCPLLAKLPSLFYLPISLQAFSPSPNYTIFAFILILWSTSEKIQTNTLTLI